MATEQLLPARPHPGQAACSDSDHCPDSTGRSELGHAALAQWQPQQSLLPPSQLESHQHRFRRSSTKVSSWWTQPPPGKSF